MRKYLVLACAALALGTLAPANAAKITTVRGTQHRDVIRTGNGGWTVIRGLGGNDALHGGNGIDIVYGGPGNDHIWTGSGGAPEAAYGGRGNDVIHDWWSGKHPGLLNGGPGHDKCVGTKNTTYVSCEHIIWRSK